MLVDEQKGYRANSKTANKGSITRQYCIIFDKKLRGLFFIILNNNIKSKIFNKFVI